ncbi:MAG: hypothetical protein VB091_00950, partial [Christensenella sp.]|nr:hypothetical protein [Christensenella sp.]
RNYSESLAATVDEEVRRILESQYERARQVISADMAALDRVSEVLIEYERMTGEEFAAVYAGENATSVLKKSAPKTRRKKTDTVTSPEFEAPPTPVGEQG